MAPTCGEVVRLGASAVRPPSGTWAILPTDQPPAVRSPVQSKAKTCAADGPSAPKTRPRSTHRAALLCTPALDRRSLHARGKQPRGLKRGDPTPVCLAAAPQKAILTPARSPPIRLRQKDICIKADGLKQRDSAGGTPARGRHSAMRGQVAASTPRARTKRGWPSGESHPHYCTIHCLSAAALFRVLQIARRQLRR